MAAAVQTERLHASLLSSISHDFRTPLSAIITSASSLRAFGDTFNVDTRADLCATIQEEAERLHRFVAKLLDITRLDADTLHPVQSKFDLVQVAEDVRVRLSSSAKQIELRMDGDDLIARGDPVLFEHALTNVVENALRFANATPVFLEIKRDGNDIIARVIDHGVGVPAEELEAIFERFYRASTNASPARGYGLGLSITRGLIEAMGGRVSAQASEENSGLTMCIAMPASS